MIRSVRFRNAIFGLLTFVPIWTHANQVGYSLDELSKSSDVIVLGVTGFGDAPILDSYGVKVFVVSFKISDCFKMMNGPIIQDINNFKFLVSTGGPERPIIKNNSKYIIFLRQSEVGPFLFDSLGGVLSISDDKIQTPFMIGEPAEQDLSLFKVRLIKNTKRFGCSDVWDPSTGHGRARQ